MLPKTFLSFLAKLHSAVYSEILLKTHEKKERGGVLRRACRCDPGVPLFDDVSCLLDIGGAIEVKQINGPRVIVALLINESQTKGYVSAQNIMTFRTSTYSHNRPSGILTS